MKIYLFTALLIFPLFIKAGALEKIDCFPRVLSLVNLKSENKIKFYQNIKLEGEPTVVISDKLQIKTENGNEELNYQKDFNSKKLRDELLKKFDFLVFSKSRYHVVFCPTEVLDIFYVFSGDHKLYFNMSDLAIDASRLEGYLLLEDFNTIKKLFSFNRYYELKSKEFANCILKKGVNCGNVNLEGSAKLLLFYLSKIENGLCNNDGVKLGDSASIQESNDRIILPDRFEVSNKVVKEALDLVYLRRSLNAEYVLVLNLKDTYRFFTSVYVDKSLKCMRSLGIDIVFFPPSYKGNEEKQDMFRVEFPSARE